MQTDVVKVNPASPEPEAIERGAALIRAGELVAFPTETVYGLGANALESSAVAKIFAAKGRPATNPLIVHVANPEAAREVVSEWPDSAEGLAESFWPGPLTLVLPRAARIPDIVTAGGPTVAVRCPSHPVALALLAAAQVPIAAPSANRSSRVSPTMAKHVLASLGERIPLILDGGPCFRGVESTVLDLTESPAVVLRPGLVSAGEISQILGSVRSVMEEAEDASMKSPGRSHRHYAPEALLILTKSPDDTYLVHQALAQQQRVGWLALAHESAASSRRLSSVRVHLMPNEPAEYARQLYQVLHDLDEWGADIIIATAPPVAEKWEAIWDRLTRAAFRDQDAQE